MALTLPRLPPGRRRRQALPVELLHDLNRQGVFWPRAAGCSSSWRGRRLLRSPAAGRASCSRRSRCRPRGRARHWRAVAPVARPIRGRVQNHDRGMPAAAAYAASAADVSPVEAQAIARIFPVGDHLLHDRDEHRHAQVFEGSRVRVAAQLHPEIAHAEVTAARSAHSMSRAALVHRDDVFVADFRADPLRLPQTPDPYGQLVRL